MPAKRLASTENAVFISWVIGIGYTGEGALKENLRMKRRQRKVGERIGGEGVGQGEGKSLLTVETLGGFK